MKIVSSSKRRLESSPPDRDYLVSLRMEEVSRHIGSFKVREAKRHTPLPSEIVTHWSGRHQMVTVSRLLT